jgi:hypothetical protein
MATGNYGIVRPATISTSDMEIYFTYSPSRDVRPTIPLTPLDPNQVISRFNHPTPNTNGVPLFDGLYNLQLPVANFSAKGIYSVVIKPKEIRTTITDCGVLTAFPDVKGIVLDLNTLSTQDAGSLIGYRVEYYDQFGQRIPNFFRVITSANRAEVVNANISNTTQKAVRYRYTEGQTNLVFCTLSPSSSPTNKPNATPFIGQPAQSIILSNTYFNPLTLEVQVSQYDIDTLGIALYGNQTKSMDDGIYTIYDTQNNIYSQFNLYEIKDDFNNTLYEVKENRNTNIDFSKSYTNITGQ